MNGRALGVLTLIVVLTTSCWAVLMLLNFATAPAASTLPARIGNIENRYPLFLLTYANACLITLSTVALFAGYYGYLRQESPLWAAVAFAFVPIYGLANLVVYSAQIFIVPGLVASYQSPETNAMIGVLLEMILHDWPGSALGYVNALAYAVLGIPSLIYGMLLARKGGLLRVGGWSLAASGALSGVALVGVGIGSALMAGATFVSAGLYLFALILFATVFFRDEAFLVAEACLGRRAAMPFKTN